MICLFFLVHFNKTSILSSKYTHDDIERHRFSRGFFPTYSLIFPAFSLSFFSFFRRSVTLVTAKKQHCGWSARTYACTRETLLQNFLSTFFLIFSSSFFFSASFLIPPTSPFFSSGAFNTCKSVFCYMCIADLRIGKEKNAHFLDFFTLCGNIDPYTNRGMHCNPPSVQELMTCIEH